MLSRIRLFPPTCQYAAVEQGEEADRAGKEEADGVKGSRQTARKRKGPKLTNNDTPENHKRHNRM